MKNWKLIDGNFHKEDALDVINSIVLEKIKYHKRKNFSNLVRYGEEHEHSIERQRVLSAMLDEIIRVLNELPDDAEIELGAELYVKVVQEDSIKH